MDDDAYALHPAFQCKPVEWAIGHSDADLLQALLNAGSDPNRSAGIPEAPVLCAIRAEQHDLLGEILDAGGCAADLHIPLLDAGRLHWSGALVSQAIEADRLDLLELLLDAGADIDLERVNRGGVVWADNWDRLD